MKYACLTLFLLLSLPCRAQKKDTVFLYNKYPNKKIPLEERMARWMIYIDPNKNSKDYNSLRDFTLHEYDRSTYKETIQRLKGKSKNRLKKIQLTPGLPTKWSLLWLYKNKYYAYLPSEGGINYRVKFTDSTMIEFGMEGGWASLLTSVHQINQNTYRVTRKALYAPNIFSIHLIDAAKGIAVFENLNSTDKSKKEPDYLLMVSAEHVKDFPLIVNYCETNKNAEFEFDKPNFKKLLKLNSPATKKGSN